MKEPKAPVLSFKIGTSMGIMPRDFVVRQSHIKNFPSDGSFTIHFKSVENKEAPPSPDYVRSKMQSGGVVIRPVSENQCIVNLVIKADLGTLLPQRMLLKFYNDFITQWFYNLSRGCEMAN